MFKPAANSALVLLASPAVVLTLSVSQAEDMMFLTYFSSAGSVPFIEGSVITDAWPTAVHMIVRRHNARVSDMILATEKPNILVVEGEEYRGHNYRP